MEIQRANFTEFHEEFEELKIRDIFLKIDFSEVEFAHKDDIENETKHHDLD
jgi:hypothetical protein